MNTEVMNKTQQSDAASWALAQGQALTLPIGPGDRLLRVSEGRVWATRLHGEPGLLPADAWLEPGDSLQVESGAVLVVEGWPAARFQLLVPPRACAPRAWVVLATRLATRLLNRLRAGLFAKPLVA